MYKKKTNKILLSPEVRENEINKKYIEELEELLEIEDCKNIALVGCYGSGKSSLLKTFLEKKKRISKKSLTITIGSYITDNNISDNEISPSEQVLVNRVEESILKQIIYTEPTRRFPKSSLIRLNKDKWYEKYIILLLIFYTIYYSVDFSLRIKGINSLNFKDIISFFTIKDIIMILLIIIFLLCGITSFLNKFKMSKIKIKDCEFELLSENNNSIFSRYLSEIVYFFQCTKYNLIIFEDLDRFPKDVALKVIQELKELNTILNSSHKMRTIRFIYSVKDNLFDTIENKNKFYDYNLSILPVSTTFSSEMNLIGLLKQQKVYNELSKKIIVITGKYIHDMRCLINIVNDYMIFKKISGSKNYDKLFGMVVFKNYYFEEYTNINLSNNIISKAFDSINQNKEALKKEYILNKETLNDEIKEIEKDKETGIEDLLLLLVSKNDKRPHGTIVDYSLNNGSRKSIVDFEKISVEEIEKSILTFYRTGNYRVDEIDIFSSFGNKEKFIEKCKKIEDELIIEKKNQEIRHIENKIKEIDFMSINEFYSKYSCNGETRKKIPSNKMLLYELIGNNFISTDYMDYISAPVTYISSRGEESLTASDSNYLMNIRQGNYSFENRITGYITILDVIKEDLSSPYVLNYDMLNFLLENKDEFEDELVQLLNNFKQMDEKKGEFLARFFQKYGEKQEEVLNLLYEQKIDIWSEYINNQNCNINHFGEILALAIFVHSDYYKIVIDKNSLIIYIEDLVFTLDEKDELLSNETVRNNIMDLEIKSYDLSKISDINFEFLYINNKYHFNKGNMERIIGISEFKDVTSLKKDERTKPLYRYISSDLSLFLREFYQHNNILLVDKNLIDKVLDDKDIDILIKKEVYKREKFKISDVTIVEDELLEIALLNEHITINWNNIINLYNRIDNVTLFEFITKKFGELKKKKISQNNYSKTDEILKKYTAYLLKNKNELVMEVLNTYTFRYENLSDFSKDELKLLIESDKIEYNKKNYKHLFKITTYDERNTYIYNYYCSTSIDEFSKTVYAEDALNLAHNERLTPSEKIDILFYVYKKEHRQDKEAAITKFLFNLKECFGNNIKYEIDFNKNLYNSILVKLKNNNEIKELEKQEDKIIFKI